MQVFKDVFKTRLKRVLKQSGEGGRFKVKIILVGFVVLSQEYSIKTMVPSFKNRLHKLAINV